jgi:hypothetical protein
VTRPILIRIALVVVLAVSAAVLAADRWVR